MAWLGKVFIALILTLAVLAVHEWLHAIPKLIAEVKRWKTKRRGTP